MPHSMRLAGWLALALLFASAAHAADPVAPVTISLETSPPAELVK